jgi:hypothetical protein
MMGTLIRCIDCNKVINMTEWDFSPSYTWEEGDIKEHKVNDRESFVQTHKGHTTEQLTPLTAPMSDKPYLEPLKTAYFEATNGTRQFLIKRWRSTIDEPFAYEIIDGRLELRHEKIQAQTEAIKKQLKADYGSSISEEKITSFMSAIHKEAEKLDPASLVFSTEGETPLISYYLLGSNCIERIIIRCQDKFDHEELQLLREFITEHNAYDGVMTIVVHSDFIIKPVNEDVVSRATQSAQRISIPTP